MYLTLSAFLIASQATAQPAPSKPQYAVPSQLGTVISSETFVPPLPPRPSETAEIAKIHANQDQINENCYQEGGTLSGLTCVLPPPPSPKPVVSYQNVTIPAGNCADWMNGAGITDQSVAILVINKESGCNPNAVNPSSGACGIGQQYPCGKWPHAWNDPVGGLVDMQAYVYGKYGTWENAWASELAKNSY